MASRHHLQAYIFWVCTCCTLDTGAVRGTLPHAPPAACTQGNCAECIGSPSSTPQLCKVCEGGYNVNSGVCIKGERINGVAHHAGLVGWSELWHQSSAAGSQVAAPGWCTHAAGPGLHSVTICKDGYFLSMQRTRFDTRHPPTCELVKDVGWSGEKALCGFQQCPLAGLKTNSRALSTHAYPCLLTVVFLRPRPMADLNTIPPIHS